jgi:hypothetical protein
MQVYLWALKAQPTATSEKLGNQHCLDWPLTPLSPGRCPAPCLSLGQPNLKGRSTVGLPPQEPGHGAQRIGQTSQQGLCAEAPTTAAWLGETSEHSHLPQNQPGLGGVWTTSSGSFGWIGSPWISLCSTLIALFTTQPPTRWISIGCVLPFF